MANNRQLKLQADDKTYNFEFHSLQHSFPLTMVSNDDAKSERSPISHYGRVTTSDSYFFARLFWRGNFPKRWVDFC